MQKDAAVTQHAPGLVGFRAAAARAADKAATPRVPVLAGFRAAAARDAAEKSAVSAVARLDLLEQARAYQRAPDGALQANFNAMHAGKFLDRGGRADISLREGLQEKHLAGLVRQEADYAARGDSESLGRAQRQRMIEEIEYDRFRIVTKQNHEKDPAAQAALAEDYKSQARYQDAFQDDQDLCDVRLNSPHADTARARIEQRAGRGQRLEQRREQGQAQQDKAQDADQQPAIAAPAAAETYRGTLQRTALAGYDAECRALKARRGRDLTAEERVAFDSMHKELAAETVQKHRQAQAERLQRGARASEPDHPATTAATAKPVPAVALAGHRAQQSADGKSMTYVREADGAKVLTDRGTRIGIAPALRNDPDAMRAGVLLASQRFGKFAMHGTPERQRALALMAIELGVAGQIRTKDPELKAYIEKVQRQALEQSRVPTAQQVAVQVTARAIAPANTAVKQAVTAGVADVKPAGRPSPDRTSWEAMKRTSMRKALLAAAQEHDEIVLGGPPEQQREWALAAVELGVASRISTDDPELTEFIETAQAAQQQGAGMPVVSTTRGLQAPVDIPPSSAAVESQALVLQR